MDVDVKSTVRILLRILGIAALTYGVLALLFAGRVSLFNPPWLRIPLFEPEGTEANGMMYLALGLLLLVLSGRNR